MREDSVSTSNLLVPAAYQTALTGPDAGPANPALMAVPATRVHGALVWAIAHTAIPAAKARICPSLSALTHRKRKLVPRGHIDVSQFYRIQAHIRAGNR